MHLSHTSPAPRSAEYEIGEDEMPNAYPQKALGVVPGREVLVGTTRWVTEYRPTVPDHAAARFVTSTGCVSTPMDLGTPTGSVWTEASASDCHRRHSAASLGARAHFLDALISSGV